jgi:hypothetical protein
LQLSFLPLRENYVKRKKPSLCWPRFGSFNPLQTHLAVVDPRAVAYVNVEAIANRRIIPGRRPVAVPNSPESGRDYSFTAPAFRVACPKRLLGGAEAIGFGRVRLHDLRGVHSTALLDAGIAVHTVAQRIGNDPATRLRAYTKRRRFKAADKNLSDAIAIGHGLSECIAVGRRQSSPECQSHLARGRAHQSTRSFVDEVELEQAISWPCIDGGTSMLTHFFEGVIFFSRQEFN